MKIENANYILEVSPDNGALVRLRDKVGGVELLTHRRLAESFRLLVPLPRVLEANYIFGTEQHLSAADMTEDAIALRWDGPLHNSVGQFDVDVQEQIAFVGAGIQFQTTVCNRTQHVLAEVWHAGL
ncbi:MAG TPA: hypothetical protein VFB50_22245, partial [Chloroflexota bacterium]|nr:hypothetical protein [Chloroflexota bacterium]